MGNRKLILLLAIIGIAIVGILAYSLRMLGTGAKNYNDIYESPILTKNCYYDADCTGRCNPRGCFAKGVMDEPATDCSSPAPSCACMNNKCEETEK